MKRELKIQKIHLICNESLTFIILSLKDFKELTTQFNLTFGVLDYH